MKVGDSVRCKAKDREFYGKVGRIESAYPPERAWDWFVSFGDSPLDGDAFNEDELDIVEEG